MSEENNSSNHKTNAEHGDANSRHDGVGDSVQKQSGNASTQADKQTSNTHPKPPIPVRLWRGLWRRRRWRRLTGHTPPNWAEKTAMYLTGAIAIAAFVQIYVYWKQKEVMEASLSQNERGIITSMGQLFVANRNANISSRQFELMQKQIVGSMAAMVVLNTPMTPNKFEVDLAFTNMGNIPTEAVVHLEILHTSLDGNKTISKPRPYIFTSPQLRPPVGGIPNPFHRTFKLGYPLPRLFKEHETVTFKGIIQYDNGFGRPEVKPICVSYMPSLKLRLESGDTEILSYGSFLPCDEFKRMLDRANRSEVAEEE
jgi:hypothetical protein